MKTYIIAEAGVNHNGSIDLAKKLIDAAAEAGADAVKFQTFQADKIVNPTAKKALYQIANSNNVSETQYDLLKKLELTDSNHEELIQHCKSRDIEFLSTPFDLDSLEMLATKYDISRIKISSGDLTNAPLLLAAARTKKPVIISTGMSSMGEIESALGVLAFGYSEFREKPSVKAFETAYGSVTGRKALVENVTILHCTTEYPAPLKDVNLRSMTTIHKTFGLRVGYSDHTAGISIPIAAVALGAIIIEKHFTLDRLLPGPDHKASLEPLELKDMVKSIREVEISLGSLVKTPADSELKNRPVARKSLVARKKIEKGEVFSDENVDIKRPGDGISPLNYWEQLGKVAQKNYEVNDQL